MNTFSGFRKPAYGFERLKRDRAGNLVAPRHTTRSRKQAAGDGRQVSGSVESVNELEVDDFLEAIDSDLVSDVEQDPLAGLAAELCILEREMEVPGVTAEVEEDLDLDAVQPSAPEVRKQEMGPVWKAFVLMALLKWIKFHGTKSALEADLKAYHCILRCTTEQEAAGFPVTIYQLHRELGSGETGLAFQYICPTHGCFVGSRLFGEPTNVSFECVHDKDNPHIIPLQTLSQSSLLTTSIELAMRKLLPEKWGEIRRNMLTRGKKKSRICEFVEGEMYANVTELDENAVTLLVHADGAKLAGSSSLKCYAIHCTVAELDASSRYNKGILQTVWVGQGRNFPHRSVLWKSFMDQMSSLSTDGLALELDGVIRTIRVYVVCVIGDAMERYPLAGLSIFHSEFGCTRCILKTLTWKDPQKSKSHRQIYPCVDEIPQSRTDAETDALGSELMKLHNDDRKKLCKMAKYKGGTERSPIHRLRKLDIIRGLPVGFMHLFLKGLFPKVLEQILTPEVICAADQRTALLNFPDVISRKPRSLGELSLMKANEFCTFMIYGLCALHELVSPEEFVVLALLVSLATTVTQNSIDQTDIFYCKNEALMFVRKCKELWGDGFLVYNVHQVLHLHECLQDFGTMAGYCELAYEDWIGKMVKSVKGFNQIPREIANTLALRHLAAQLMALLQKEVLPLHVTNLLEELSHIKKHKISVELEGRILLGATKTVRWLQKKEPSSFNVLCGAVGARGDELDDCVGKVFDKMIVGSYCLSNRTSFADENANALFYDTAGKVFEFRFAVQYFKQERARGPTFIIAKVAHDTGIKPFNSELYLPIFTLIAWSDDFTVLTSSQVAGVAVEMPYFAEHRLLCRLPALLFRMD